MAVAEGDRGLDERLRRDREELDPVCQPVAVERGLPAPDPPLFALPYPVPVLGVPQGEAGRDPVELAAFHVQEMHELVDADVIAVVRGLEAPAQAGTERSTMPHWCAWPAISRDSNR